MKELLRTNDLVLISVVEATLGGADIVVMVADQFMSAMEGSLGFLPRRLMVSDDDYLQAIRILRDSGLGEVLNHG